MSRAPRQKKNLEKFSVRAGNNFNFASETLKEIVQFILFRKIESLFNNKNILRLRII